MDVEGLSVIEIVDVMNDLLDEFKRRARQHLSSSQYEMFKYRCLGHCEPVLKEENEWLPDYNIDTLMSWAEKIEDAEFDEGEEEEDE